MHPKIKTKRNKKEKENATTRGARCRRRRGLRSALPRRARSSLLEARRAPRPPSRVAQRHSTSPRRAAPPPAATAASSCMGGHCRSARGARCCFAPSAACRAQREKRGCADCRAQREKEIQEREAEWNLEVIRSRGSHHMWWVGRIDRKFCSVRPTVKTTSGSAPPDAGAEEGEAVGHLRSCLHAGFYR